MIFKNEKELEKFVLDKCKVAVAKAEQKVYAIIKRALVEFYRDYDPTSYVRTLQLLHSLVKSQVRFTEKGYEAKVYFDLGGLSYNGSNPSGEQVMEAASQGFHGAMGEIPNSKYDSKFQYFSGNTGVDVWNTPIVQIKAEVIDKLVNELKAQGIPIIKR